MLRLIKPIVICRLLAPRVETFVNRWR